MDVEETCVMLVGIAPLDSLLYFDVRCVRKNWIRELRHGIVPTIAKVLSLIFWSLKSSGA